MLKFLLLYYQKSLVANSHFPLFEHYHFHKYCYLGSKEKYSAG